MASGKPLLGVTPPDRLRVWLWNGEDPREELERRMMAAAQYFELTRRDFEGYLFLDSGRPMPIIIAEQTKDGAKIAAPVVDAVTKTISDNQIDVLVVDPFVASHRVTENDNNAIEPWQRPGPISPTYNCAIDLVHHARKTGGREMRLKTGEAQVALLNAARSARVLNGMTESEAEKAGIDAYRSSLFLPCR